MTKQYRFDGETFDDDRDGERLSAHMARVRSLMADHAWYTLALIAWHAGCSEASASARLRDLRKERFGSHTIDRRYVGEGLWEYRLVP